ncbi:MAG TPA: YggS family pyridoxal phosphate-dependent enzyme [Mycobacteriales bacterium]|nr:YggS family pyridoxal phosphate-dependent enzyme [Mycobacteriales bacterium]
MTARRDEIEHGLLALRERIEQACATVGRDPDGVTLIAVTKTFPASDVRLLAELGVTDVGENRDQEARAKHDECVDLPLRWHFVGQLQRNKARSVAHYVDVVHSADRLSLVTALSTAATDADREVTVLVQVSLGDAADESSGRAGVPPDLALDLADAVALAPGLLLGGVMAVAPPGGDADVAFARLARAAERIRQEHPAAAIVSAGMSADLDQAIRHGATHVRIGTALLGHRAAPVG